MHFYDGYMHFYDDRCTFMMDGCTFIMDRCTFMMDRCTFIMDRCTFLGPIHSHYKAWKFGVSGRVNYVINFVLGCMRSFHSLMPLLFGYICVVNASTTRALFSCLMTREIIHSVPSLFFSPFK